MIEKVDEINLVLPFIKKYFPNYTVENSPYEKMFCHKNGNNIIGFISYSVIYERAELNYIVTDEQYRRKGIGTKLINYYRDNISEDVEIFVKVFEKNMNGIIFFSKLQFKNSKIQLNEKFNETEYVMIWKKD